MLEPSGCYLLDNTQRCVLWVGRELSKEFLEAVFGVSSIEEDLNFNKNVESDLGKRVRAIIAVVRAGHPVYKPFIVIKQVCIFSVFYFYLKEC